MIDSKSFSIRSINDQDNVQQLLSPLKRLRTNATTETTTDTTETVTKTEPVKPISKTNYMVKVIYRKTPKLKCFLEKFFFL